MPQLENAIQAQNVPFPLDTVWAIEPLAMGRIIEATKSLNLESLRPPRGLELSSPLNTNNGVAIIDVLGVLTKRPSLYQVYFNASSTQLIRQAVEMAAADQDVRAILLRIDSPGGSVEGLAELGDAVFAARQSKPVYAQIDGMSASAAYYIASQAEKIFAGRMDLIGSIGTRLLFYDWSRLFANEGIEAVPIDTGEFKSAAAMGTEITDRQRAYFQSIVDQYFADFVAAIVRGRGMTEQAVRAIADGRIMVAGEAKSLNLIDGIQSFDQTLEQLHVQLNSKRNTTTTTRNQSMSEKTTQTVTAENQPQATTLKQLREACPKADNDFLCGQLEKEATVDQARAAWIDEQNSRIEASKKQLEEAKAQAAKPGVDALGGGSDANKATAADPIAAFDQAVAEKVKAGMPKPRAISAVVKADPDLHEAYLAAHNEK